jgi:hypothetical protein
VLDGDPGVADGADEVVGAPGPEPVEGVAVRGRVDAVAGGDDQDAAGLQGGRCGSQETLGVLTRVGSLSPPPHHRLFSPARHRPEVVDRRVDPASSQGVGDRRVGGVDDRPGGRPGRHEIQQPRVSRAHRD